MPTMFAPNYARGKRISNAPTFAITPRPAIRDRGMVATRRLPQAPLVIVPAMVPRSVILNTADTEAGASRLTGNFTPRASLSRALPDPQNTSRAQMEPPSNTSSPRDLLWESVSTPEVRIGGRGPHTTPQPSVHHQSPIARSTATRGSGIYSNRHCLPSISTVASTAHQRSQPAVHSVE